MLQINSNNRNDLKVTNVTNCVKSTKNNEYCKALFIRGGLIFVYFAENENSAKIKPAKILLGKSHCKSFGVVCMHAYCTTHTKLLSLSAEIHKVPVLHPFIVLCTLWIALPTSTHKLQSILANKRKRKKSTTV